MRLYRKLWLLDVAMMAVCVSSMYCAGAEPFDDFQSEVDGDRPIRIVESEKLRAWASGIGKPAGARQRMLDLALPLASHMWNVHPTGAEQLLPFDLDDAPDGPCVKQRLSLWSIPGQPRIFACPAWIECSIEGDRTLFGQAGCNLALAHELGHVLGARKHAAQGNRPPHLGGPVMCGWASDCIDPHLTDYTAEDVALICGDGGHGGRCPA